MGQTQAQRNRKVAARSAKRKAEVESKKAAERFAASTAGRIAVAARGPIVLCRRTTDMQEAGIGHVVLARRMPSGLSFCAFFLVDLLCLGVKDVFSRQVTRSDLDEYFDTLSADGQSAEDIDPAFACKIVTGAAAYAAKLGLAAHKSYPTLVKIFGDIDPASSRETVTFGREGEPFYIPGPRESLADERSIIATLTRTCGPRGFDMGLPPEAHAALRSLPPLAARLAEGQDHGLVIEHEDEDGSGDEPEKDGDPSS